MIHIDICPSCEELGDSKPKLLCDNCGFCIERHCDDYCETASLLRALLKQGKSGKIEGKKRGLIMRLVDIHIGSFARGIVEMRPRREIFRRWTVRRKRGFWCILVTPVYHEGRGPYVSIGLGRVAIYRGY